jgi:hypothetical protein
VLLSPLRSVIFAKVVARHPRAATVLIVAAMISRRRSSGESHRLVARALVTAIGSQQPEMPHIRLIMLSTVEQLSEIENAGTLIQARKVLLGCLSLHESALARSIYLLAVTQQQRCRCTTES